MGCGRAPTGVACKQGTSVRPAANVHVEFRREVKNIAQAPFESHRRIVWEGVCLSTLHLQIHFSADNRVISLSASDSGSHSSAGCEKFVGAVLCLEKTGNQPLVPRSAAVVTCEYTAASPSRWHIIYITLPHGILDVATVITQYSKQTATLSFLVINMISIVKEMRMN